MIRLLCCVLALWSLQTAAAIAQTPDEEARPAFSLSSSEVFTSRDNPSIYLTFRHLPQLDFRVYKVRDAVKFFSGLRDPHQLGGEKAPVPTERTWIERLADWKRRQRGNIRSFLRDQVSYEYRSNRRAARDKSEISQRVVLNKATFAQVPLLNPDQLVSAWREILPDRRDAEMRRIPLEVKEQGVYVVEAVSGLLRAYTVVMVADVGLVTKVAPGQILIFAANRLTGEPRAGCDVRVLANQSAVAQGTTDAEGVLELNPQEVKSDDLVTVATCGNVTAATDPRAYALSAPARQLVGYIYTDKPIYRPGHTAHVKAVLRWRERDALRMFDRRNVELSATDANDKVIFRQSLDVDAFGTVNASIVVPATAALGNYALRVTSADDEAFGSFEVQEYRRPEFEVIATPASRFVRQGQDAIVTVQARYYFGQPVANARVHYVVNRQPYYSPYRWDDSSGEDEDGGTYFYGNDQIAAGDVRLDAQGRGEIKIATTPDTSQRDYSLRIEAQVTDASSREVSGSTIVHATYGSFLIGTQVGGYIFRPGQRVPVTVRALDYEGRERPNVPVTLVLDRLTYRSGYYSEPTVTRIGGTSITLDASGRGEAQLALGSQPGSYRITATAPEADRSVAASSHVWIPGDEEVSQYEGDRFLELLADKKTYAAGDTARLIVRGEQISGPVLLTKEGQHVTWHRVVRATVGNPLEVPIDEGDAGDIYVNLAYMRDGRLYRAERRLSVPAQDRALQISITADQPVAKPQQPGVFSVNVKNAAGVPVQAQISLGVIDEAIYAIKPESTPDPLRFFYRRDYSRVSTTFSRDYYFIGHSGSERLQLARRRRRPFSLADFKGDTEVQPQVRKDFPDAIHWTPDLVTDSNGNARVSLKYPDALTTWRLTARAVTRDTLVGAGLARTTTTKDLIVRVVTPRFLTEGDQVVVPTIVHNYLDDTREATVSFQAKGLQPAGGGPAGPVSTSLPPNGEHRDDWRFTTPTAGTAVVTAVAKTNTDADAVELPIPVLPYGLRREAGRSGALDAGDETIEVTIPAASNPAARSVRVSLAPSMAGSLLGALDYLTSYPYGCTEQTLSSFLPNLVVTRALAQLKLAPTERMSVLDRQVGDGLKRLLDYQHDDGGWGWWKTDQNHPFMTAYALYGLAEARREGYEVDGERVERGLRALAAMYAEYPRAEPDLKAYIAFVLGRAAGDRESITYLRQGDPNRQGATATHTRAAALNELWNARDRMSPYGRALLLLALDDAKDTRGNELATRLMGEAQTTGDLSFWKSERDPLLFDFVDTSVEATATAVRALARRDPRNPLLDRAARWLMLNRAGGYWLSTKQTAIALYGLLELLQARNETPQTLTADVYVNGMMAGSHTFTPASLVDSDPVIVSAAGKEGTNAVRIVKRGGGRLYWSATSVYFDTQAAEARSGSRQLAVTRAYALLAPVKRPNGTIAYREQPFDGQVRPGDVLSVRITTAGSKDWKYLVLEDPLPAGVEAIQDTTAYPLERDGTDRWYYGSRVEYRDSRTVFFQESFDQGRYEFLYLVRAISSGEFRAVPAQIAPMYVPDIAASSEPFTLNVALPSDSR